MDRETLSNFGWIVVVFIILSLMLAFASPLTDYALGNVGKLPDQVIGTDNCEHEHTATRYIYVKYSGTQHQKFEQTYCTDCDKEVSRVSQGLFPHTYDAEYRCTACGYKHTHVFDTIVSTEYEEIPGDAYSHYTIITKSCACGETMTSREKQTHRYGEDDEPDCIDCGAARSSITYLITYNANGGTGAPTNQTKRKGVSLTLSSTVPTNGTKTFVGWGLTADSTVAAFMPGQTYNTDEGLDLYAIWKDPLIVIDVPVQSNAPVYDGTSKSPTWTGYDSSKMTISGTESGVDAGEYIVYFTPKEGYCWEGEITHRTPVRWSIGRATISSPVPTQNGTLTYNGNIQTPSWNNYDENKLSVSGEYRASGNPGHTTYYTAIFTPTPNYKWSDGTTTGKGVTWSIGPCTHSSTHEEYVAESPTQHYKSVICDLCGAETVASVLELHEFINHVCWKCGEPESGNEPEDIYVVTFNPNGGTGGPDKMYASGSTTLPTDVPVKENCVFVGWSTSSSATSGTPAGGTYNVTSDVTLYAVWHSEWITITFDTNGGYGGPSSRTVRYNEAYELPSSTPSKSGYTFDFWRSPATGSPYQRYYAGGTYTFTKDITLTAVWAESSTPPASGDSGGSSGSGNFATCSHEDWNNYWWTDGPGGHLHCDYCQCKNCGAVSYFADDDWIRYDGGDSIASVIDGHKSRHLPGYQMRNTLDGHYCPECGDGLSEYYLTCQLCGEELGIMDSCGTNVCPNHKEPGVWASYGWSYYG